MVMRDSNAPQRTRTAYVYFCDKHRDNVVDDNPDSTMVEISALMGSILRAKNVEPKTLFASIYLPKSTYFICGLIGSVFLNDLLSSGEQRMALGFWY
eukprot:UN22854